jgi:hypothetical protein
MTDEPKSTQELTDEELEQADGKPLPDREAMSILPVADPLGGDIPVPVEPRDDI